MIYLQSAQKTDLSDRDAEVYRSALCAGVYSDATADAAAATGDGMT